MKSFQPRLEQLTTQPSASDFLLKVAGGAAVTSLLFTGPAGTGKKTHALAFVKTLFCRNGPTCPGCADCRQVEAKTHPDLLWVQKDAFWSQEDDDKKAKDLTVGVVGALTEKLALAPLTAAWKVAVVPDAHRMNTTAQDKFLKTLEEPPRRAIIILLTDQAASLRPTILSRCRPVRFQPLPTSTVEAVLRARGIDAPTARAAAHSAGGDLTRAFAYADPAWRAFLDKAPTDFASGLRGGDMEWMKVTDEYDQLDPGFWEDEELTASQRKSRVASEFLRAVLSALDPLTGAGGVFPGDPVLLREAVRRHLDLLSGNLSSRMVLDHLFLEAREIIRVGRYEPQTWMDTLLRA